MITLAMTFDQTKTKLLRSTAKIFHETRRRGKRDKGKAGGGCDSALLA
ncbi:hypothetical protein [Prosthecobacter sp.]